MIAYLLAIGCALSYGAADFIGGWTTRRAPAVAVVAVSQLGGLVLLGPLVPFASPGLPSAHDLLWGAVAGLAAGTGILLLYRALAVGTMSVVSPATAVTAVSIPVLVRIAAGERPAPLPALGIGLAIAAIVLVSRQRSTAPAGGGRLPSGLAIALASGVGFGVFYLALAQTRHEAGAWPLLAMNVVTVSLFGGVALFRDELRRMPRPMAKMAALGGIFDFGAHALYLFAVREGPLPSVVTLSSLYPATTIILARLILRERLTGWQMAGIACALAATVLIVRG